MADLSHRERVIKALNHEEPDRVPLDLGQCIATGITATAYIGLVEHLGLDEERDHIQVNRRAQTAIPSETVLRRFDIDCRRLELGTPEITPEVPLSEHSSEMSGVSYGPSLREDTS